MGARGDAIRRLATRMHARERRESGSERTPVVMVHGFVISGEYFMPTVERLPPELPALVPDLPGFGRSPGLSVALTVPQLGTALIQWIECSVRGSCIMLANSFGCQIATEAAMRRPDLVERLVLVSPAIDPGKRRLATLIPALIDEADTHSANLQKMLVRHYLRTSPRRVVGTLRHALWDRMEDKLPHISLPALVVWGNGDPLVSRQWAEAAAAMLPNGALRVVDCAPHAMNFDAPGRLVAAVEPFLDRSELGT